MRVQWGAVWIAAGCGGGVHTSKDAPFAIGAIRASLWSVATLSDEQSQLAILVLSDAETECVALDGTPFNEALDVVTREGKGVVFYLEQEAAPEGAVLEWTGTWTDGGGSLPASSGGFGYRELTVAPFETGVVYNYYSAEDHWLRIDDFGDNVVGEFWSTWYWGSFKAEACGNFEFLVDTGYYTPYSPP